MPRIPGKMIADGAIGVDQAAGALAGAGLTGGGGSAFAVNVDGSTLEVATDTVQVKAAGISNSHISGTAAIALSKLAESVVQADGGQAFTADQSMGGFKLTNLGTPAGSADAVTKAYADAIVSGLSDFKGSVVALADSTGLPAYTQAGAGEGATLTASANGAFPAQDGVTLVADDRVLVCDPAGTSDADHGIYTLSTVGDGATSWVLTRATDADADAEVTAGTYVFVSEGTTYGDSAWVISTNDPITVDTTTITFVQFSGLGQITAGNGLQASGNELSVEADATTGGDVVAVSVGANGVGFDISGIVDAATLETDTLGTMRIKDGGVDAAALAAAVAGNGLTGGAGSALAVDASNDSISVAVGGVSAAVPTASDKAQNPSATTGNGQDSALDITGTPAGDSYVQVLVNGVAVELGDGVTTKDCYFSVDGGTTPRAVSAIAAADSFFWNGTVAGYDLAATDEVDFNYATT